MNVHRAKRIEVKRRQWSQEDMDEALKKCRAQEMNITNAAKTYNVPRKTMTDRLKRKVEDNCCNGRRTVLNPTEENSLCSYIEYMATRGFPLTINQIIMFAWCIDKKSGRNSFEPRGPTEMWWQGFKKRHPDAIKLRKPDSLDRGRALFSTVDNLRSYFTLLKKVLQDGSFAERPRDIYNCDKLSSI